MDDERTLHLGVTAYDCGQGKSYYRAWVTSAFNGASGPEKYPGGEK